MTLIRRLKRALRRPLWTATAALPLAPLLALPFAGFGARVYLAAAGSILIALGSFAALTLWRSARRTRSDTRIATRPAPVAAGAPEHAPELPRKRRRELAALRARLNNGWSESAGAALRSAAADPAEHLEFRVRALETLSDHYAMRRTQWSPGRHHDLDVVIVSTLNLLGGTTSANEAEILAYRAAGLRVGLIHHSVLDRALDRPVHPRLRALVDGEQIVEITPFDTVRCDLLIARFPIAFEHLMEDLPQVDAARTVLLVNQTPHEEYGIAGGYGTSWSVRAVHENLTNWIGPHTWYAIGPAVRDVLRTHHADQLEGVDLATDFWYETIDVAEWTPRTRRTRAAGAPVRLGRHSRDHVTKFPNMAQRLLAAYPAGPDIEVHVLGGEQALRRILGGPPPRWVSHPFGEIEPVEFLGSIDVHSYFIDEQYIEAFGRSPLEAMAAGVPCIMPWSFAELFGDGAVYCEPEGVEALVRRLADDPEYRRSRIEAGMRIIDERFSPAALVRRVRGLGVEVDSDRLAAMSGRPQNVKAA